MKICGSGRSMGTPASAVTKFGSGSDTRIQAENGSQNISVSTRFEFSDTIDRATYNHVGSYELRIVDLAWKGGTV